MLFVFNIIGVIAFAISGALKGLKHELDIFGIIVLGGITAVGGGIIRDIILNKIPIIFMNELDIYIAISSAIITYTVGKKLEFFSLYVKIFDAIGLATFVVIGSKIALNNNMSILGTGILATLTGVGGGVVRDILVKEIPFILKEDIYATLCFFGGMIYWVINKKFYTEDDLVYNMMFIFIIFIFRILAIKYNLNLPKRKIES
ncbi:putative membrane protein YeiH [Hypnocyclicus thermotrophus]|uniref:Membrane protein YeiH n=1 Tax=Hypnocyclicus thermotrophus TaxID=1627895 RepID=A0AA46I504_9FUSO|nr:trimeric intracellular cation channel family protein [Hypnocyclicus thermotrophus]TDT67893.1 putative membrane protein YeiH [Hypnocyclicus thermotrophus]